MSDRPIADYAMLSDCHSAALVSGAGSVDWLCVPRFDSPSVFGRMLDPGAGHWSIRPPSEWEARRRYLPGSLVLETRYDTPTGTALLTDALILGGGARGHELGAEAPHALVRVLRAIAGEVAVAIEFAPRPEYGLVQPIFHGTSDGLIARGGKQILVLSGPTPTSVQGATARWQLTLRAGEDTTFALRHHERGPPAPWNRSTIQQRLTDTLLGWRSWSELHDGYEGPWREQVRHGGRVLKGLTFQPTGALVAAPTTSLPGEVGGDHNWDYRYGWLRGGGAVMSALETACCRQEQGRLLGWLTRLPWTEAAVAAGLQVAYDVGGNPDLSERELPHLSGWQGSRPVRVGNAAWAQRACGVLGELIDAIARAPRPGGAVDPAATRVVPVLADTVATHWIEPDTGIWDVQRTPRHYVASKLMCWVALDRAIQLASPGDDVEQVRRWARERAAIRATILERGWSETLGAYRQILDVDELDASVLLLAISGFLPATDPRMGSTIDVIAEALRAPCGLLYRYAHPGRAQRDQGTHVLCTYWLVECLALAGDLVRAREVFEHVTAYVNDVGLLSEQADTTTGELLGNFPYAPSHVGLVNAAAAIRRAESDD